MKAEIVRCAECGGQGGMLRIVKGYSVLGHLSTPVPVHPFRFAPAARNGAIPVASTGQPEGPNPMRGNAGPSTQRANATRRAPDGQSRTAATSGTPSPSGQGRRSRGIAPRPLGSGPARSAGQLHASPGKAI